MFHKLSKSIKLFALVVLIVNYASIVSAQQSVSSKTFAIERTNTLLQSVRDSSYPELQNTDIEIRLFNSKSDFFRTRFSVMRYFFGLKMHFFIEVNPKVFELQPTEKALHAIIAHELGHVLYMQDEKRIKLFSLICLASKDYTARFERRTDLEAISRGYATGLIEYRNWLYQNISAKNVKEKKRDYFSPEEISAITESLKKKPALLAFWIKHIPLNLAEIKTQTESTSIQKHHF